MELFHWNTGAVVCIMFGLVCLAGHRRFAKSAYESAGRPFNFGSVALYEHLYFLFGLIAVLIGVLGLLGVVSFGD